MTPRSAAHPRSRTPRRHLRGDTGSIALELVVITPVVLIVLTLLLAYGRYGQVTGLTEQAARDAARAATLSRSPAEAQARAERIVEDSLGPACAKGVQARVVSGTFHPGDQVRVRVTCEGDFAELGFLPAPGAYTVTREFVSALDPYRGVAP